MGNYDVVKWAPWFKKYIYVLVFNTYILVQRVCKCFNWIVIYFSRNFLNHIVMAANGGEMPVFPSLSYLTGYLKPNTISKVNDIHMIGTSTVKYKYLSDIIDVGYSVLSIGDILIRVFVVIIIYVTVKKN